MPTPQERARALRDVATIARNAREAPGELKNNMRFVLRNYPTRQEIQRIISADTTGLLRETPHGH